VVYFPGFGMFYQEKSGNPSDGITSLQDVIDKVIRKNDENSFRFFSANHFFLWHYKLSG
jgi:hypothetical protein